ncbi:hypothetical protein Q8A73_013493 [Channa argus]|nr:hypothetical protein Q8A73_013493 [Channa argus]
MPSGGQAGGRCGRLEPFQHQVGWGSGPKAGEQPTNRGSGAGREGMSADPGTETFAAPVSCGTVHLAHSGGATIRARLTANPHKPAIPMILLANVRLLDNKPDYIRLLRSTQRTVRDCSVFVFTETWLSNSNPDGTIQLDQLTCYRADRALVAGGKTRGGGLCVYTSYAWCRDAVVICKHCSPLVEFMIIKCRPFYLPREYTAILFVSVYISPNNNISSRNDALNELH